MAFAMVKKRVAPTGQNEFIYVNFYKAVAPKGAMNYNILE